MLPKPGQLELFGGQKLDPGQGNSTEQIPDPPIKDHDCRDPTHENFSDQSKKAHLTEIQKERAKSLYRKSKDLVLKAYQSSNPPQVKSE